MLSYYKYSRGLTNKLHQNLISWLIRQWDQQIKSNLKLKTKKKMTLEKKAKAKLKKTMETLKQK